jgi:uncharacterized membrane protein
MISKNQLLLLVGLIVSLTSVSANASMHPDVAADGLAHFMWHMQMTTQAAMTGNWPAFWQLFTEQSVCADSSWQTFVFTPLGFMFIGSLVSAACVLLMLHLVKSVFKSAELNRYLNIAPVSGLCNIK